MIGIFEGINPVLFLIYSKSSTKKKDSYSKDSIIKLGCSRLLEFEKKIVVVI